MVETKSMWLMAGQYHCDEHKPVTCMPFGYAPLDAECAECSNDSPLSYLKREGQVEPIDPNAGAKLSAKLARLRR